MPRYLIDAKRQSSRDVKASVGDISMSSGLTATNASSRERSSHRNVVLTKVRKEADSEAIEVYSLIAFIMLQGFMLAGWAPLIML